MGRRACAHAAALQAHAVSSLTMRLADPLVVRSITSDEYGRLFSMRVRGQNSVVVNLPAALLRGTEFSITVSYARRLDPQALNSETLALQQPGGAITADGVGVITPEPSFLYSNRSNWYPERPVGGFTTATLRIMVPAGLACVASGELDIGSPELVPGKDASLARMLYVFNARQPLRYLAFIVSRFATAQTVTIGFPPRVTDPALRSIGASYRSLNMSVEASPWPVHGTAAAVVRSAIVPLTSPSSTSRSSMILRIPASRLRSLKATCQAATVPGTSPP